MNKFWNNKEKKKEEDAIKTRGEMLKLFESTGQIKDENQKKQIEEQIQKYVPINVPKNVNELRDFSERLDVVGGIVACATSFKEQYENEKLKTSELTGKLSQSASSSISSMQQQINSAINSNPYVKPDEKQVGNWDFNHIQNPFANFGSRFQQPQPQQTQSQQPQPQQQSSQQIQIQNQSGIDRIRNTFKNTDVYQ